MLTESQLRRITGPGRDFGHRTFRSYAAVHPLLVIAVVVAALLAVWQAALAAGGSRTVVPHLFYIPIMLATVRFGWTAAILTAGAAGILSGPLLPSDVLSGAAQAPSAWLTRLSVFVLVGLLLAWLTGHTRPTLLRAGRDAEAAARIRAALRKGQITAFYQPQVDLGTGEILGLEALARWEHPKRGLVPPDEFVPVAERTGLIGEIDRAVLVQATRQLAEWTERGFGAITMAVNVSAQRFHDPELVRDVADVLHDSGIEPERIHLEITETAIIPDLSQAAEQITALRELGVKIAVDDFGAGQSSLAHLHRFSVDIIKIDRSFVEDVACDERVSRLVAGLVRLFDSVGVAVIAEGISGRAQFEHLREIGCPTGQGFHFARPRPAAEVDADLASRAQARSVRSGRSAPSLGESG